MFIENRIRNKVMQKNQVVHVLRFELSAPESEIFSLLGNFQGQITQNQGW